MLLAIIVLPMVVDVQKYKPQIEEQVANATGRSFALGDDIELSVFPWVGVALSDLHIGNPEGFQEPDLVSIDAFEVRVKLIPLLSKNIQIKRFVLKRPRIVLERNKAGIGGWEGLGSSSSPVKTPKTSGDPKPLERSASPLKALAIGEFAITDGVVLWLDQATGTRKEISALTFRLADVSLDQPITMDFSAALDGQPLSVRGTVGPLGQQPGQGRVPLSVVIEALTQLKMKISGEVNNPASAPAFNLSIQVDAFSPRQLLAALGMKMPIETADPNVLKQVALGATLSGSPTNVEVRSGLLTLDESKVDFTVSAKNFSKPDLKFDINLDQIDLDRYLPPNTPKDAPQPNTKESQTPPGSKPDYTPLKALVMDSHLRAGKLKAKGARVQDIELRVTARNGVINIDPLQLKLYQGQIAATGAMDLRKKTPQSGLQLKTTGIQVAPFLEDFLQKELLEGTLEAQADIQFSGDTADQIKKTLTGQGGLAFRDGAIIGVDLAGMARNAKAAFGLAEKSATRPKTDFSEFLVPFTIKDGLFETAGTRLQSPLLRLAARGQAHLPDERLDFRVEPKFVATLQGQGDTTDRSGITVPVLVSGSFSQPKFQPDLEGLLKQTIGEGLPQGADLQKALPQKEQLEQQLQEGVKGLLKGLPFGPKE